MTYQWVSCIHNAKPGSIAVLLHVEDKYLTLNGRSSSFLHAECWKLAIPHPLVNNDPPKAEQPLVLTKKVTALLELTTRPAPYRLDGPRPYKQHRVQRENSPISLSRSRHFNTDMSWKPSSLLSYSPKGKSRAPKQLCKAKAMTSGFPRCLS